jgi:hypothetical protein
VVLDLRKTAPPERTVNAAFRNGAAPQALPQRSEPAPDVTFQVQEQRTGLTPGPAPDVQAILTTPTPSMTSVEVSKEPSLFSESSSSPSLLKKKHRRWWHVLPTTILP